MCLAHCRGTYGQECRRLWWVTLNQKLLPVNRKMLNFLEKWMKWIRYGHIYYHLFPSLNNYGKEECPLHINSSQDFSAFVCLFVCLFTFLFICSLLNDTVSYSSYILYSDLIVTIMNLSGCRRKWSWPCWGTILKFGWLDWVNKTETLVLIHVTVGIQIRHFLTNRS